MGGYGSTRWNYYTPKTQVEDGLTLHLSTLKKGVRTVEKGGMGWVGSVIWKRGADETDNISYRVYPNPLRVVLSYKLTPWGSEPKDYDYPLYLQSTPLPWGGVRWWFTCPLVRGATACQRRVGVLFKPLGAAYFGCRHCYDLAYRSNQEQHKWDGMYARILADMGSNAPLGMTIRDVGTLLDSALGDQRKHYR